MVALIRRLVEIESPTRVKDAVDRVAEVVCETADDIARVTRAPQSEFGDHLRLEMAIPTRGEGQILGLGHMDTVYPLGTLEQMPWREDGSRLHGPGVFDMKAGLVYLLFAARALRDLGLPCRRRFVVRLNSDEEIGSPSSTALIEEEARRSDAVLVAEPSAGLNGSLKTARKGGAEFRVVSNGVASHAGLDFHGGANAIVELAEQIRRIAAWTGGAQGRTLNAGQIRGGTATNVVPAYAECDVDVRFSTAEDGRRVEKLFRSLEPVNSRCTLQVTGGIRKLPLERSAEVVRLYRLARSISAEMGVELGEASVGGGSDGNTTAALGVPTLDGLGAVGEGAHASHESILVDRIADRAALIATLVHRL